MKWVKVAIGAVIAISVVGLIVGAVNTIITPKPLTIDFEIIDTSDIENVVYSPNNLKDKLVDIAIEYGDYTNNSYRYLFIYDNNNYIIFYDINDDTVTFYDYTNKYDMIIHDNYIMVTGYELDEFPIGSYHIETGNTNSLSPSIITLIGLVPLIFVGGVVSYLFVKTKKEE